MAAPRCSPIPEPRGQPAVLTRQYDSRVGGIGPGNAPDSGAIVVTESRQQVGILFGFLILAFAVALARGAAGAQSASGRAAVAVFCGSLEVAFIAPWNAAIRHPARLEVTEDGIRYVRRNGQESRLSRQWGDELRFAVRRREPRIWTLGLTIAGTDTVIVLGVFSRNAAREACHPRGWRFD
jgi:hypothetical protein